MQLKKFIRKHYYGFSFIFYLKYILPYSPLAQRPWKVNDLGVTVYRGDLVVSRVQLSRSRTKGLSITRKRAVHSCGITEELQNMLGISQL